MEISYAIISAIIIVAALLLFVAFIGYIIHEFWSLMRDIKRSWDK